MTLPVPTDVFGASMSDASAAASKPVSLDGFPLLQELVLAASREGGANAASVWARDGRRRLERWLARRGTVRNRKEAGVIRDALDLTAALIRDLAYLSRAESADPHTLRVNPFARPMRNTLGGYPALPLRNFPPSAAISHAECREHQT